MDSLVALVGANSSKSLESLISQALDLVNFKLSSSPRSVVIKPNLAYYWDASTGYTTDPKVVSGLVDCLRERYGEDLDIKIAEADASAMRTKYAFPALGYEKLAEEKGVELLNLSNDDLIDKIVHVNGRKMEFKVPQLLLKSDLFVNVPKLKIMRVTKITCAMKNIFGCIGFPRKFIYHPFLNEAIVGINKILHPHLTVVDGLIALGRFPVRFDLIMAGVDPFSVDCIASEIMGYKASNVKFLQIAKKENLGNPSNIVTVGEDIEEFKRAFPKENFTSSKYWWNIQFWLIKIYRKIVGDVIPPFLEEA